jgi:hypothetical protein
MMILHESSRAHCNDFLPNALPEADKDAFRQVSKQIVSESLVSNVKTYDENPQVRVMVSASRRSSSSLTTMQESTSSL